MIDKTQTKVIIGIAAAVWLVVALVTGPSALPMTAVKSFSIAATVATLLLLAYDRFLWKLKPVRAVTGKPLVAGTWRGELRSDFIRPGETEPVPPIPVVMRIKQTNSTLFVTMFTGESQSVTEQGQLIKEGDDRWRLSWIYINDPRASVQHRSQQHRGTCDLYVSGKEGECLKGKYFTSRKSTGEIDLDEWSKHNYGDAESALNGTDFGKHKPFVRPWFS